MYAFDLVVPKIPRGQFCPAPAVEVLVQLLVVELDVRVDEVRVSEVELVFVEDGAAADDNAATVVASA
jgi:hypothetical protein